LLLFLFVLFISLFYQMAAQLDEFAALTGIGAGSAAAKPKAKRAAASTSRKRKVGWLQKNNTRRRSEQ